MDLRFATRSLFIVFMIMVDGGCNRPGESPAKPAAEKPPTEVSTIEAKLANNLTEYREFVGRTAAINSVDVRARVSGYLVQSPLSRSEERSREPAVSPNAFQVRVREGELVTKGTPLFEIDPTPYRLILAQAEGNLAATQAQLKRFDRELQRAADLLRSNAISKADYELAIANQAEAQGRIANLIASVDRAKLDLTFTQVLSPIDGVIGQTLVTDGNLVSADSSLLSTIVSTDPIQAYFDVDESSMLEYRSKIRNGTLQNSSQKPIVVELKLKNEASFTHQGVIDFVDNITDPNSGNTRMRGKFANASNVLSPGLFVRVRLPFSEEYDGVLIPTRSLSMDQVGRYAMVVDESNIVHRRSIRVGSVKGDRSVILEGIQAGESVVVAGLQKIRNGDKVVPKSLTTLESQGESDRNQGSKRTVEGSRGPAS